MIIWAVVFWGWVINGDLLVSLILMLPRCCLWGGQGSLCQFVMLFSGFVLRSAVILGKISMGWRSAVWCVMAIAVGTWASVAWETTLGRSVGWPGAAPMGVSTAATPISMVMWVGLGMTKPGSILVIMVRTSGVAMMPRGGSITPVGGITSAACQCARWWYLIQAVHGNMSIITVIALYMGAIACHMADFLTMKTPVIITGHSVDQWGG